MQPIDFSARVRALAARLKADGVAAYVGTRQASLHYLCGTFMPWRGAVIVTADGGCEVAYWAMDAERIKAEGCPHAVLEFTGSGLIDLIAKRLAARGDDQGRIGLDLAHPGAAQIAPGMLTAGEYLALVPALPQASLINGVGLIDDLMLIKSPAEIERLRRSFTNNADQVIAEFDRADDAGRDHLAQDPAKYDVLRNHLHPRLRAEYARQQSASISA